MILKSLGLFGIVFFLAFPAAADDSQPVLIPIPAPVTQPDQDICQDVPDSPGCQTASPAEEVCKKYNRDGVTCAQVHFTEGQVGYPWGQHSGAFRCTDGCLAWVGQANQCKEYNRDGVTCTQVGFHDGQVGYPWGWKSGKFRCVKGCLQFLWW